jgi:hypothetical protein
LTAALQGVHPVSLYFVADPAELAVAVVQGVVLVGRLLGRSSLVAAHADEKYIRRNEVPTHAFSETDRLMARPQDFTREPQAISATACWRNWHRKEITPHDGLVRTEQPLILAIVERTQSASSLRLLLPNPVAFVWRYGMHLRTPESGTEPLVLDPVGAGTVPVLALDKCDVARCWVYVKDDRPFGGSDPPAAMFYYSRDRSGEHPQAHLANYTGILQADAFGGYIKLYEPERSPGLIREAACWVHARRPFFAMADLEENARRKAAGKKEIVISPVAMEIVRRIDALFEIERSINGQNADQRKAVRQAQSAPLVADLEAYMREQCAKLSRGHDLAKAMNYMFKRWASFTRFLDDGRVCLSNNAAERALRGIALGRKSWLFCGSDRGGRRAAAMYSLIVSAKMNDVDPQAWLADVLARIATHPAHRLDELLPWNWKTAQQQGLAAQAA